MVNLPVWFNSRSGAHESNGYCDREKEREKTLASLNVKKKEMTKYIILTINEVR